MFFCFVFFALFHVPLYILYISLTCTGTVLCGIETEEFTVQFSYEHSELIGIPFGEIRRKGSLSERSEKESCFLFLKGKKKAYKKAEKYYC